MLVLVLSLPHHSLETGEGLTGVASTDNIITGTAATCYCLVKCSKCKYHWSVITATSFEGSGALLTGLPAGFTELDAALFN